MEESSAELATLETFARHRVQRLLQQVLEEEVDEPLGRRRYERRAVGRRGAGLSQRVRPPAGG